jgi:asparagine synthase (glutamine-hydrolysing)
VSKFCGIFHFDSRPASAEDEVRLRTTLDSPGCFTPQTCRQPGLLMGWVATSVVPQSKGLFQAPDRSVCLWDGRLDNRKQLLGQTGLSAEGSDAALILALFHRNGIDGLRDLLGDWSLCIWDAGRRQIVLASDYAGIRPLYYRRTEHGLYWSSSIADLVRWTGVAELDDTYVANFLVRGSGAGRTPYAGIVPVPAGHAVTIGHSRIDDRAFWTLPIRRETSYADEKQYQERLLELFREAVQVRLANGAPTCAELSGGLDSSSVVCMADRLRRETPGGAPELITFSYTHENSPDERFFREVERACDVSACHLELRDYPVATADLMGTIPALWEPRFRGLARRMEALGAGVLLTGQLGDFVMGNTHDDIGQVTESLARGQFGMAARTAYAWARAMQAPIYPILWRSIREAWFSWVPPIDPGDSVGAMPASTEDSLVAALRSRLAAEERERTLDGVVAEAPPGRRRRFRAAAEVLASRTLQTPEALQHISYAHPYAHRPLLEFMLTIPANVVVGPDEPRQLMRRSFAGLLPPMVLRRKSKGSYSSIYRDSLKPLATELLTGSGEIQLVERGYVERESLMSRLGRFTQGLDCNESQLRQILIFEFWLRKRMADPPSCEPAARSGITISAPQ